MVSTFRFVSRGEGVPGQCTELPCFQCGNCIIGLDLSKLNGPVSPIRHTPPALFAVYPLSVGAPLR